jgi:hypothetical protein
MKYGMNEITIKMQLVKQGIQIRYQLLYSKTDIRHI